tara:strand:+ start:3201 stop:3464 length:264 start_codon:yes stop_codon:yes gene_type:complete
MKKITELQLSYVHKGVTDMLHTTRENRYEEINNFVTQTNFGPEEVKIASAIYKDFVEQLPLKEHVDFIVSNYLEINGIELGNEQDDK